MDLRLWQSGSGSEGCLLEFGEGEEHAYGLVLEGVGAGSRGVCYSCRTSVYNLSS